jgi:hypothetical protein
MFGKNRRARIRIRRALVAAIGLCLLSLHPVFAQSKRIDGGTVSQEKFGFYWETRLQPGSPPLDGLTTETTQEPGVIHRLLLDRTRQVYAGYDFVVQPLAEPNTYSVTIRPLSMNSESARRVLGNNPPSWTQMRTPGWSMPTAQTVKGGDVLELTLFNNRSTGQNVIDYVTIQEPTRKFQGFNTVPERKFSYAPGPSRDFKADDVELTIQMPRLSINGKLDESTANYLGDVSGAVVWFYTAKRGRFLLSLVPRPELGFRKAGEIRGSSLRFMIGSDVFTLSAAGSIAPGQAAYSLYVLHEPDWRPTYLHADLSAFIMGSLDPATLGRK